jgi:hypothetical protein
MTQITNIGRKGLDFVVGSKDGKPLVEHVAAGETKNIDLDKDSSQLKARLNSRQIKLGRATAAEKTPPRPNRVENPEPNEPTGS